MTELEKTKQKIIQELGNVESIQELESVKSSLEEDIRKLNMLKHKRSCEKQQEFLELLLKKLNLNSSCLRPCIDKNGEYIYACFDYYKYNSHNNNLLYKINGSFKKINNTDDKYDVWIGITDCDGIRVENVIENGEFVNIEENINYITREFKKQIRKYINKKTNDTLQIVNDLSVIFKNEKI